jgi:hypothetical protein
MKNKIKFSTLIFTLCIFCVQCQAQVTLEGMTFLDMPFKQVDFNTKNVFYKVACQGQDLNNDGLKDAILFLNFPDASYDNPALKEIIKKSTLICLQESSGNYRVTAVDIRLIDFFKKSSIACIQGGFTITTEGDRYDNHTYTMEFTYKNDGFYMTKKIVESEFEDQPIENIKINDKSVPLKGFSIYTYFYKYMIERDARQKKMYPDG